MRIVRAKIDDELKRRMDRFPDVNWSEVIRNALRDRVHAEEVRRTPIDRERAIQAARWIDAFRRSLPPSDFDSTKEIRKWRDRDSGS
ncbi:MAG TPA: hypothetical protein VI915_04625 [Thermoplasmata archaeon]|nr:hypothetical protein [Thermoplasmata archaeon]